MTIRQVVTGVALALSTLATPTQGSLAPDPRWLAFEGCWRPTDATAGMLVCIVTDGKGVRMVELADGAITRETALVADGVEKPLTQQDCSGTERLRWSSNGRRVYMDTQLTCGAQIARSSTGLFALLSAREWVHIQAIAVDIEAAIRTIRYQLVENPTGLPESIAAALRTNGLARETARYSASAPLELDDIREASEQVHGRVVEALVFERKQGFDVDGNKLLALIDAGVPAYVVDALVAVSNPERFALQDEAITEVVETAPARSRVIAYCDDFDLWYSRHCGSRFGYSRYGFGYDDYGYGYGRYRNRYGYTSRPVVVVIRPGDEPEPQRPHGRVTRRGYTNGSSSNSRSAEPVRSSEARSNASSTKASSSSSSSSGSTTTKSSGSSSSSSSTTTTTTDRGKAKPRGGS